LTISAPPEFIGHARKDGVWVVSVDLCLCKPPC
jgi:hypothetical protein